MSGKFDMTLMTRGFGLSDSDCLTTAELRRDVELDVMFNFINDISVVTKITAIRASSGYSSIHVKSMSYDEHRSPLYEKDVTVFLSSEPYVLEQVEIDNIISIMFADDRFKDYFERTFRANISPIFVDDCPF